MILPGVFAFTPQFRGDEVDMPEDYVAKTVTITCPGCGRAVAKLDEVSVFIGRCQFCDTIVTVPEIDEKTRAFFADAIQFGQITMLFQAGRCSHLMPCPSVLPVTRARGK